MQTLDLINYNKSDIKYKLVNFPDGEPHIILNEIDRKDSIHINCRICNPNDLFILLQIGDVLNRQAIPFSINIYYLMSMRMDRVITFNESFSLKVVADLINSINPTSVHVLEPHSIRTSELINNCVVIPSIIPQINNSIKVYPDAGAFIRYNGDPTQDVVCKKVRDPKTGALLEFSISNPEVIENNLDKTLLVIDDLCDGGGTFAGIAALLEPYNMKKYIYVTHMVNPKGIKTLSDNYDQVLFTNSYKNWFEEVIPDNVTVFSII